MIVFPVIGGIVEFAQLCSKTKNPDNSHAGFIGTILEIYMIALILWQPC